MPQLFNGCHREELHPATVQAGKTTKCNDVAIFLLKLLSIQLPTWKAVFPKVDAIQLGKGNSYVLTNQSFTQLWHDIIFIICCHNFRRNASGNSRYASGNGRYDRVTAEFWIYPHPSKKTAVSPKRHSRPAIKKPLFYKKSFLLSGRIAITPLPPFGWIIFHILAQGRKSISKKRNETSTNRIRMIRPSL